MGWAIAVGVGAILVALLSTQAGASIVAVDNITYDPSTWPGDEASDPLWAIAHAIARAEGANVPGSNPDRLNNPGDLSDGAAEFGFEPHSGSNVTHFPTKTTGWQWLYNKLSRIQAGQSAVYFPGMTWIQLAQKWAGDWSNWVANVSNYLGVDPNSTFADYTGGFGA